MSPLVHLFAFNTLIGKELKERISLLGSLDHHPITPSKYQEDFFLFVADETAGNAIVNAVAGSGKTTTCLESILWIPGVDLANATASTFHSAGYGALIRYLKGKKTVNRWKIHELARQLGLNEAEQEFIVKIVGLAKGEGVGHLLKDTEENWLSIADHHDLGVEESKRDFRSLLAIAQKTLQRSNQMAEQGNIDFDDQIYLPVLWNLRLKQYDYLYVDECFVPETPILLNLEGEQKTIRELVEDRYSGQIATWSEEKGTHLSRVTGWKKVPVGKPMIQLKTRARGYAKNGERLSAKTEAVKNNTRIVICTADHKIWTDKGWLAARDLKPGMTVKHETVAPIIRSYQDKYKHTAKGRESLRLHACLVEAEVIGVEPWQNKKIEYVYDLEVEGSHCYFAHGLLVHNCQDTNPVRREIAKRSLKPGGRLFAVGDPCQSIYGFTGASPDAMDIIKREFQCKELPLTISYRCPKVIAEKVRPIVPYFEVPESAPEGSIATISIEDIPNRLTSIDAVLCRENAPLVELAFILLSMKVKCALIGQDIGQDLIKIIQRHRAGTIQKLTEDLRGELFQFKQKEQTQKVAIFIDKINSILTVIERAKCASVYDLIDTIKVLFTDEPGVQKLSLLSVHKAKGKEYNRVAILCPDLMPSKYAKQQWQMIQEKNLMYVAWTRCRLDLLFLPMTRRSFDVSASSSKNGSVKIYNEEEKRRWIQKHNQ